jgi:hypothetical protein
MFENIFSHVIALIHGMFIYLYHCTRVETEVPEQEVSEFQ